MKRILMQAGDFAMRLQECFSFNAGGVRLLTLVGVMLFATPLAFAEQQTGTIRATCNIQGQASPMELQYTRYRDAGVWQDRHGLNSRAIDMQQWGTTYWEGTIDTPYGAYRLTGENSFIEAWKVGGVYSDMITLELKQVGPERLTIRDFFNGGPAMPCRITDR
jgi:hypothetical protein